MRLRLDGDSKPNDIVVKRTKYQKKHANVTLRRIDIFYLSSDCFSFLT